MEGLVMKYFVLNPTKDDEYGTASRLAIFAYTDFIKTVNPQLAKDLLKWVTNIQRGIVAKKIKE